MPPRRDGRKPPPSAGARAQTGDEHGRCGDRTDPATGEQLGRECLHPAGELCLERLRLAAVFLGRRLRRLANEREKLLRAYYADAIDVETLKREQVRINAQTRAMEAQLSADGESLKQAKEIIDLALDLAKNCAASYRKAKPDVRKMWNQAFFRKVLVREGRVAGHEYEEPFASLLGSHKAQIVEVARGCVNRWSLLEALREEA